ncbi:hypothetical protein GCM10010112_82570 [Actinoplanes lobatus]|uniref:Uncharacterized protein n=1 Tax=Actinoplanes lobatus TaxID=113568 RepID=A0A7W7HL47_9ACTN|nr:hypothetical protein [Actinoplanes lobatus]MBB4752556.1 hypothetical protein [Actinoplanes lobatus]GGN93846.1 hypothetical protein GCM10010112_82570 [Actinoplanes lobatus]GIE44854.1 hypothetical protein Alo02nite_77520 [Actinoplanes lobatus]
MRDARVGGGVQDEAVVAACGCGRGRGGGDDVRLRQAGVGGGVDQTGTGAVPPRLAGDDGEGGDRGAGVGGGGVGGVGENRGDLFRAAGGRSVQAAHRVGVVVVRVGQARGEGGRSGGAGAGGRILVDAAGKAGMAGYDDGLDVAAGGVDGAGRPGGDVDDQVQIPRWHAGQCRKATIIVRSR